MTALVLLGAGLVAVLVLVAWSSRGLDGAVHLALAAVLGVAATAFNLVVPVPSVELTSTVVLCVAATLGLRTAVATGLVAVLGGSLTSGAGTWTIWQVTGVAFVAVVGVLASGIVRRSAEHDTSLGARVAVLGPTAAVAALGYDLMVTVPTALVLAPQPGAQASDQVLAMLLLGAPFTAVHVAATAALTVLCAPSLGFTLARARLRLSAPG